MQYWYDYKGCASTYLIFYNNNLYSSNLTGMIIMHQLSLIVSKLWNLVIKFLDSLDFKVSHCLGLRIYYTNSLIIPCLMSKFDKWYIIRKLLCSTFRICEKISKFAKIEFFCKIQLYSKKVCKKTARKMINYTFLKRPWPRHFKYVKSFAKF